MKSMIKTALFTGISFGVGIAVIACDRYDNLYTGIVSGVRTGILIGIGLAVFIQIQKK
jgi:uncharacterized membrane protein